MTAWVGRQTAAGEPLLARAATPVRSGACQRVRWPPAELARRCAALRERVCCAHRLKKSCGSFAA